MKASRGDVMLDILRGTELDVKVAAAIEKKRQIEEERKARIFNPRVRRIGVDKEFLDKQVEEKKRQRELERQKECRLDEALLRSSKLAIMLAKEEDEARRKLNKDIDAYRQTHQKTECRRDFDLYDPELPRKTKPLRQSKEEDQLGPASVQKFEGEDENVELRRKEQKEQMQSWIMQQVQERRLAEKERREAERLYQEALLSRDNQAMALERDERKSRRQLNEATAKFNKALAEEQDRRRRVLAAQDDEDKRAEIYNHVTGDFLTESKDQAQSTRGPDKPLAGRYKGMTEAEVKAYRDAQAKQMEETQQMRADENKKNEQWNKIMNGNARAAESYQLELDRRRVQLRRQMDEENQKLAEQQKLHQSFLNQHVYKHVASPEFYKQFNQSTR